MSTQNREILHQMKKIFYPKDSFYLDWMGFEITPDNQPSYHHIVKAENQEDSSPTIDNGAYLGKKSHELLHRIEQYNKEIYMYWNDLFQKINDSKNYPTKDMIDYMYYLKRISLEIDYMHKQGRKR